MSDRRTTRRQVLGLGAAAFAAASLKSPAAALADRRALFELDLSGEGLTASAAAAGWRTTRVLRAPRRFDLIGLRWAHGSRAEAQVRARRRGGRWTPWAPLHVMGDHGPDGARAVAGTDPAFVGAADEFQLRLRGNPRALRARFVRALPTATVARRVGERLRRRARASARPRQTAGPSVRVITRSEWGGDSVPPRGPAEFGSVELAFVHHTVTTNTYNPEDSAGIVLGIARYHRDSNGWNDLGYNFLVDKYGQVFEGRAGGIDAPVIGAQAQGYNSVSTGIAVLGTYTDIANSEPGMEALARLIGWKLTLHGVPVQGQVTVTSAGGSSNRYRSGTPVTFERISGHRDGDSTSCPGRRALRPARRPAHARGALHQPARGDADDVHVQDRPRRQGVRGRRRAALLRRLLARGRPDRRSRSRPAARPGRTTRAPSPTPTGLADERVAPLQREPARRLPGRLAPADGVQGDRGQGRAEPEDRALAPRGRAGAARCGSRAR